MVITITGAAGMLGSRLVQRLTADGHQVRGVDLRADPGVTVRGDIRDPEVMTRATAGANVVIHCAAALPSYPAAQIRSIVVDGTDAVFGAASRARVDRVVHISSTAVYGLPRQVPTPEEHPREPVDTYSAAKAAAEEIAERHRGTGLPVAILRPKTFLGPGRMGLFAMLFEWAEEGRNFPVLGRGDVRIQMFAVDDLVDAVVTVLAAPDEVADDTYNLAAQRFRTLREDFQAVLDAAGHGKRVVGVPAAPALAALGLLERARLSPVYGRLLHKLRHDSYVSVDKARERLGFTPRLSNQDAILRTYEWWRAERHRTRPARGGRTSRDPWRQGALALAKIFF
ncbi:NAD-dependent epimerase/dehydratase family protein [Plantactinospora sp. S1510]|uniref:NAD-dependent epimerase/dehydratase family protein n=1 Tax=Plantactinospora alkalitolerans TaxID=2789879 RepID=A0ABS0GV88_9ACTN|nr:NAD-dependent epimerase/dehydratase family protein [Plantactinospora alkalitolerans]MBF9130129.1 NAD-dependent epimerase/dehydratase family protein [Plantactinospora alkalitolerans]